MDKTQITIAVLVGALIASGVFWFTRPTQQVMTTVTKDGKEVQVAGSQPIIPFDYFVVGDVRQHKYRQPINQASTTVCSFLSPQATSTLVRGSITLTVGTTTTTIWEIGKDTTPTGTSTLLGGRYTLGALELGTLYASTTLTTSGKNQAQTIAPSQYVNFKYGGPIGALNVLEGACNVTFEVVQ